MADNFQVLDSSGSTVTFRSTDVGAGVECSMSIPANTLGTPMIGQATMATSIAVVIASDQSALTTIISALPNPVTSILATGANAIGTVSALQLGSPWGVNLTQLNGTAVNIGQQVMTASVPVVIASNQSTLTAVVSGTVTAVVPNPTTTVISGTPTVNLTQLSGTTLAIGQGVMTASIPVVIASNQSSLTAVVSGTVTAVVPNPTTAVISGTPTINLTQLNGTTLTIGQGVMTASIPVVIASNQSNLTTVISSLPNPITAVVSGTVTAVVPNPTTAVISGTPTINLTQLNGTTLTIGQGVMTASIPVVIASNQSTLTTVIASLPNPTTAILAAGSNAIGTVSALQLGSPWGVNLTQVGGSAIAFGSLTAASSIPVALPSNQIVSAGITNVGGAAVVTGGASGLLAVGGATASGSPITGNPVMSGSRSLSAELATTAAGSLVNNICDLVGKLIVMPYANKENLKAGGIGVNTTSTTSLIAAVNATNKIYLTGLQFGNTGAVLTRVTFNDTSASVFVMPASSEYGVTFPSPMVFTAGTAVVVTFATAIVTGYINAQGYFGT